MYADNAINITKIISSAEEYVITNDRKTYLPILHSIEEFAANQGAGKMIIGGQAGIFALCDNPIRGINPELWMLELFSLDIASDMKALLEFVTQRLRDWNREDKRKPEDIYSGDYRTIMLRTSMPDREYILFADHRVVAVGKTLGERKGTSVMDAIRPVMGHGPFGTPNIALMPRELQIMRVCHSLCMPNLAGDWATTFIPLLCSLFNLKFPASSDAGEHTGGVEAAASADVDAPVPSRAIFDLSKAILTGEYAVSYYTGAKIPRNARMQYVCSFEGLDDYVMREHMTMKYIDLRVPDDFRLRKITLRDRNDHFVADLFNQLSYEPIPVNHVNDDDIHGHGPKLIASPFNVLRLLFVDIWALSFLIEMHEEEQEAQRFRNRQRSLRDLAIQLWKWIIEKCPVSVLFPTEYVGIYEVESSAKRKATARKGSKEPQQASAIAKKDLIDLRTELFTQMKFI